MNRARAWAIPIVSLTLLGVMTACAASYEERMEYLRTVALQGVEVHDLIVSQEGKVDAERCSKAFEAIHDMGAAPYDDDGGRVSPEWKEQIEAFFVDSCVSGVPKEVAAPGAEDDASTAPQDETSGTPKE